MRFLIISDIHANWDALDAVLSRAEGKYDVILNCGDLVGYGPEPNRVVDWCRATNVAVVRGNHDKAAVGLADLDWFNPFTGLVLSAFVIGVTGSIFAFWGWDTCLTLGEESKDPTKVPGRAGLLCVMSILLTYLLVAVG